MERRISAILAADMVGFSRLIEADEVGTLDRQKAHLTELIDPKIAAHGGKIIKLTGDGAIAEFPSVVEAVKCAVSIQSEMVAREADTSEEHRIKYRVGINLGDVIFEDDDIYGDGVNIAARLEALAEPGGIVVSGTAYDLLKTQVAVGYKSLGEKHLKNIATPVRVYQITNTPDELPHPRGKRFSFLAGATAIVVLAFLGGLYVWWSASPRIMAADPQKMVFSLPEKPSIAVAPFESPSGNPQSESLSEGLSASLISILTFSPDIVVISTEAMMYMQNLSAAQISEKYGVQYVLGGSVQANQETVRVSVQLIDALNGRSIWAEQWDRDAADIFAVQDEITERVFEELQVSLTLGETARTIRDKFGTMANVQDMLRGLEPFWANTTEGVQEAEKIWRRILSRNPELAGPNELMSYIHFRKHSLRLDHGVNHYLTARRYIERAIEIGGDGSIYAFSGLLQHFAFHPIPSNTEEALASIDFALGLNPGDANVLFFGGLVYAHGGRLQHGIELMQRGMRLQPYHPPWVVGELCHALYQAGRFDESRFLAEGIVASDLNSIRSKVRCLGALAAMSVEEGNLDVARGYVAQFEELLPQATTRFFRYGVSMVLMDDQAHVDKFIAALETAGLR